MKNNWTEKYGKISEMDRSFDLEFWQAQTDEARFEAGWELVVDAYIIKGKDLSELQFQRTIENFGQLPR